MSKFIMTVEEKFNKLKEKLRQNHYFTLQQAAEVLQIPNSTVRWTISEIEKRGYISRIERGKYTFNKEEIIFYNNYQKPIITYEYTNKLIDILEQTGYEYFISGLDVLGTYMHHIPENYPIMLFVYKHSLNEVIDLLNTNHLNAVPADEYKKNDYIKNTIDNEGKVIIYSTSEFNYAKNGFALKEKAFVDLYFEITRNEYPLSLQELGRIYLNLVRKREVNKSQMVTIATRRKINKDIRYIVDYEGIQKQAYDFVEILKKEDEYEL